MRDPKQIWEDLESATIRHEEAERNLERAKDAIVWRKQDVARLESELAEAGGYEPPTDWQWAETWPIDPQTVEVIAEKAGIELRDGAHPFHCGKHMVTGGFLDTDSAKCGECGLTIRAVDGLHMLTPSSAGFVNDEIMRWVRRTGKRWCIAVEGAR